THYLHDATNNAVSNDTVVGLPYHIQWVSGPKWTRSHDHLNSISAVVSSGGRIFYIIDEGPTASVAMPPRWSLVARDAYNGVLLWKRPIGPWEGHLRGFRSGPPHIARRLVAVKDRVYVTLGYGSPVSALDAATGKLIRTYKGTDGAVEIVYENGVLFIVADSVEPEEAAVAAIRPFGPRPPMRNKRLMAIKADTGKLLWKKFDRDTYEIMPATLAVSEGRVFFQNTRCVVCLSARKGKVIWRAWRPVATKRPAWSTSTLVVYGDVESDVNVDGRDIHEIPDAHHLPDIDGMDLFILPPDRECTMITEGIGVGGYNLTINRIEGDVTRVFEFSTNTTTGSTDVIKITRSDALSLSSSEEKTYDLSIRYSENGTQQEFNVVDIPISETEEQIVTVIEWYNLSNPEAAPVELMEGDTTVSLSNGMTGEDVKREKTAKDSQGTTISMEIGIILVVVIVIAGFVVYRLNRTSKELMKRLKENERRRKEVLEAMEIGAKAASQLQAKEREEEKDPRRREDGEQKESTAIKEDSTSVEEENTAVKREKTELSAEEERASSGKEKEVREEPSREEDDDMEELPDDEFGFD
ncbi:MAG TPA: hypothetical protein EYP10_13925, partial [Armatimonadetes bacterium]|nr:hypothetical protein [Armatimonadota bacterium]